jgi:uncharacterized protein (DUF58 family)
MPPSPPDPARLLARLDWTVVRRLDGLLQGDYRTLFRGFGLELAEIREYRPGDDVRSIDWHVTARMQVPYVRRHVEDRDLTAWFLLDLSPSVDFGAAATKKRDLLVDFTAVLARLLTRHGNRVGAMLYTGKLERIVPAGGGRAQVQRLLGELGRQPRLRRAPETDLAPLLETALRTVRRRSLWFVVSDFLCVPGWQKPLAMAARRHEVLAVRLTDPLEARMPDVGPLLMEDAETGEQLFVDTHDRGFRERFAEAARRRGEALSADFSRTGIDALTLSTDSDMVREIARFAAERRRRRGLPLARTAPHTG